MRTYIALSASSSARPASACGVEDRDAGGSARGNGAAAEDEGQAVDRLLQRGRLGPGVGLAEIPQQQRELVAAEPADHVGGAHLARQRRDDGLEHLIARGVPEGVVDRLQAIDVEHDQRAAGVIALDVGDRAMEFALEAAPVRNIQQEVGIGGGLQFLDSRLGLGQLGLEPANRRLGVAGRRRRPGFRRRAPGAARLFARQPPLLRRFAAPEAAALVFFFMAFPVQACL